MTNEQFIGGLVAFILANAMAIFGVLRWGVSRAIKYTHLERDVQELQKNKDLQDQKNDKVQNDLKGLSMKIDKNELKEMNAKIDKIFLLKS